MEELTYALITPYSLVKSRTGGIIGRLLALADLDLVAARMFIFSDAFVDAYMAMICPEDIDPKLGEAWRDYLDMNLRVAHSTRYTPRCMVLLFRGPNAARHLKNDVIGSFTEVPVGDTIRGTFGDLIRSRRGRIRHFEPAVITAPVPALARRHLDLLARHSAADGGVLTDRVSFDTPGTVQTTLVLLKPETVAMRGRQPGNVIDAISRTGLKIVGARLVGMTVATAEALYGHLRERFKVSLRGDLAREVYARLHAAFPFTFTMHDADIVSDLLAERNATAEFNRIVRYLTGVDPDEVTDPDNRRTAGRAHCLALLYRGPDAVAKVNSVMVGINPIRKDTGEYRSEFARNLVRTGAHASATGDEAERDRAIVGLADNGDDPAEFADIIRTYLERKAARA
ncbi:MAG: hypothetical protein ACOC7R_00640 [Planctomycetota bacterium]